MLRPQLAVVSLVVISASEGMAQTPAGGQPQQPPAPMTFFITSAGPGDGANLGGLAGADAHCARLAQVAGVQLPDGRVWRAYLSAVGTDGRPVNARDRIGPGPWHNKNGAMIAATVADLHGDILRDRNSINKEFALDEKGQPVKGRGDTPNQHDILTGSDSFGRAVAGTADSNCSNWTSNAATGGAMVGHHDRSGGGNSSWNSAHMSRGCGQANLVATGGAGLFYCFAGVS
jgi:hypothetical protein